MKDSEFKRSNRIIIFFVVLVITVFVAGLYFYSAKVNYSYQPYVADHIAVVFKGGNNATALRSDEFILADAEELEGRGRKVAIVNAYDNQGKNIDVAVKSSDSI